MTPHPQTLTEHVAEVIGGTPLQIIVKTIVAAIAIMWGHINNVSTIVMLYGILVVVDEQGDPVLGDDGQPILALRTVSCEASE